MNFKRWLDRREIQQVAVAQQVLDDLLRLVERDLRDSQVEQLSDDRRFATAYGAALSLLTVAFIFFASSSFAESASVQAGFVYVENSKKAQAVRIPFEFRDGKWLIREKVEPNPSAKWKVVWDGRELFEMRSTDDVPPAYSKYFSYPEFATDSEQNRPLVVCTCAKVADPQKWAPIKSVPSGVKQKAFKLFLASFPTSCFQPAMGEGGCFASNKHCKDLKASDLEVVYSSTFAGSKPEPRARTFRSVQDDYFVSVRSKARRSPDKDCTPVDRATVPKSYVFLKTGKVIELKQATYLSDAVDVNNDGVSELIGTYDRYGGIEGAEVRYFLVDPAAGRVLFDQEQ